jgi:hypothetical protein
MHVAINLGEEYSHLAGWENDRDLDDACIKVRLPGLARFNTNDQPYQWDLHSVGVYIAYLQREYLLPSRKIVESAALSVPGNWTLRARKALLKLIEEILGLEEAKIIPQPLALTAGYNRRHRSQVLRGDIMIIQGTESSPDFALLSSSETAGIVLETQFRGDFSRARQELAAHGYRDSSGWRLDYVLVMDQSFSSLQLEEFLSTLAGETEVICQSEKDFAAAEGLFGSWDGTTLDPSNRLSLIYPYDFYFVSDESIPASAGLRRIPFDTANLELAYDGIYRLTSLDYEHFDHGDRESARVKFSIYELPAGCQPPQDMALIRAQQVLDIDSSRGDLPLQLVVILDMAAASLRLDLALESKARAAIGSEVLRQRLATTQDRLLDRLRSQGSNDMLVRDWEEHRLTCQPDCPDLAEQVQTTLFHLKALLQLWKEN